MLEAEASRSSRFFDPWLVCTDRYVNAEADNVIDGWENRGFGPPRIRKRRAEDQRNFAKAVRTIYANMAYAAADASNDSATFALVLAKPSGKRTRYEPSGFGQLATALGFLADNGVLALRKSRKKGVASAVRAGPSFRDNFARLKRAGLRDFRQEGGETIIVSHVRDVSRVRVTEWVEYSDARFPKAERLRNEMATINSALAGMDVTFEPDGGPPVATNMRRLRRIFNTPDGNPRFDLGGRAYFGWWIDLKRVRRHHIRIEGKRCADLDFSAMFLRLAYAATGVICPPGDLYAGILQSHAEDRYREGLKVVVNAMLFRETPLTRLPKGTAELLPPGSTGATIRQAILRRHSAIADQFETGTGMSLMKTESDILVATLLRLIKEGIAALPIHDGMMVRHDLAARAAMVMRETAESIAGVAVPVKTALL